MKKNLNDSYIKKNGVNPSPPKNAKKPPPPPSQQGKSTINRISWNEYFMKFAELSSERSVCLRRRVGAVIVKDFQILSTGYNGPPKKIKHCDVTGCIRRVLDVLSGERHELCRGLHAEQNAIIQAAVNGVNIKYATIYCTNFPCVICAKMIINCSIRKIVYRNFYNDENSINLLKEAEISLWNLKLDGNIDVL